MDDKVIIRKATIDDIGAMADLLGELFSIEDDFTIDAPSQIRGLRLLLQNTENTVLVVQLDNSVIAMGTVQRLVSTAMGGYVGLIEDLIVSEQYRGRGIGKELLTALVRESELLGLKRLALAADSRNAAAIDFYHRYGFLSGHMGLMYKNA